MVVGLAAEVVMVAPVGVEMAEVVEAGEAGVEMEHPQPRQAHCHRRPPRCTRCSMMM